MSEPDRLLTGEDYQHLLIELSVQKDLIIPLFPKYPPEWRRVQRQSQDIQSSICRDLITALEEANRQKKYAKNGLTLEEYDSLLEQCVERYTPTQASNLAYRMFDVGIYSIRKKFTVLSRDPALPAWKSFIASDAEAFDRQAQGSANATNTMALNILLSADARKQRGLKPPTKLTRFDDDFTAEVERMFDKRVTSEVVADHADIEGQAKFKDYFKAKKKELLLQAAEYYGFDTALVTAILSKGAKLA